MGKRQSYDPQEIDKIFEYDDDTVVFEISHTFPGKKQTYRYFASSDYFVPLFLSDMDYIRNSKNRKLKTQIIQFFSRISFGTHRLGFAGKGIVFCMVLIFLSLFFDWMMSSSSLGAEAHAYSAFSLYTGGIGYGIIVALFLEGFFLLSHSRKENLRAYVPFRLSDAQAIVFINSMLITAIVHFLVTAAAYSDLTEYTFQAGFGLKLGLFGSLLLLLSAFFFSQNEKERAVKMSYLGKTEETTLSGYEDILDPKAPHTKNEKKNMTLPI